MTLSPADRSALSDLVHRYAAYVDDRRFDCAAELFTEEAELRVPDPPAALEPAVSHRGRQAIAAAVGAVAQLIRTEHAMVGEIFDGGSHPGSARGRVACIAHHWNRRSGEGGEIVDVVWHLRYDDDYESMDAGWRISRRALTINAIETRPVRRLLPREPAG
ncbi:nuclear transport factor 2 family protein [Mycobacterium parmense]|uniref:Uncharacterized protein n=1 Tax=Mycobacterium parmense TaxID=185642 RepID=A0A7I7YQX8_9MYCO|nr:nuclear transport factor 2 family protein [Mycobacterium parmense]MCV7348663.1 nuclear transport factor 2 family protein [Mycobacterium parmense]ORW52141.1 hypothetical protein AWC20_21860 [Mycobacterium parmense]BBZ44170.1 hypothetical protein MPRM_14510 [Mycobacterium parmense]